MPYKSQVVYFIARDVHTFYNIIVHTSQKPQDLMRLVFFKLFVAFSFYINIIYQYKINSLHIYNFLKSLLYIFM